MKEEIFYVPDDYAENLVRQYTGQERKNMIAHLKHTDHCGVLRIKTEKILPEYMMYALQAEGEYERFSRNNRASAQRIRSLVVQAPETKIQKNIIDELKALDDKINGQNAEIEKYENSIRTKFDQIFHLEEFISDGVFSKYEGYSVEDLCIDGRGRVINQQYIENHKGPYRNPNGS